MRRKKRSAEVEGDRGMDTPPEDDSLWTRQDEDGTDEDEIAAAAVDVDDDGDADGDGGCI